MVGRSARWPRQRFDLAVTLHPASPSSSSMKIEGGAAVSESGGGKAIYLLPVFSRAVWVGSEISWQWDPTSESSPTSIMVVGNYGFDNKCLHPR